MCVTHKILIMTFLFIIVCGGGKEQNINIQKPEAKQPEVTKSILMVIAPQNFRDEEFKEPFELLTKSGFKVTIASTDTMPARGMLGMIVRPQILLSQIKPDSFDGLIIVGGIGCKILWDNEILHKIVQNLNERKKPIGAICIAPVVLARAEVLKDKNATVYPDVAEEIKPHCAGYTGNDVEISDNIITASGPQAAKGFAKAFLEALSK